jgi:hypothetical protein
MNKITSLPLLASLSLLRFSSFFAPKEALAVLEVVGAAADPVSGEDKVVAITSAAVVVTVTPVLAQHTQPTGKQSTCSGWSMPRTPPKRPKQRTPEQRKRSSHHAGLAA